MGHMVTYNPIKVAINTQVQTPTKQNESADTRTPKNGRQARYSCPLHPSASTSSKGRVVRNHFGGRKN